MSEFNDRMSVQRRIIQIVNKNKCGAESLFGLSSRAIERWLSVNMISPSARIAQLLNGASSKLFFLAAKSQEQISDDYRLLSSEVEGLIMEIESEVGSSRASSA